MIRSDLGEETAERERERDAAGCAEHNILCSNMKSIVIILSQSESNLHPSTFRDGKALRCGLSTQ